MTAYIGGEVVAVVGPDLISVRLADGSTPMVRVDPAVAGAVASGTPIRLGESPSAVLAAVLRVPARVSCVPRVPAPRRAGPGPPLEPWLAYADPDGWCRYGHDLRDWGYFEPYRRQPVWRCEQCRRDRVNTLARWRKAEQQAATRVSRSTRARSW